MKATVGGHKGGLELGVLINLIQRTAYRQHHVALNRVGVQKGLPPDVATVQLGTPDDGLWWNLKRGMIPERDVRTAARVEDNEEILEMMHKYGMQPIGRAHALGISKYEGGQSMLNPKAFKKRIPAKLLYVGWRAALRAMLINRGIRGSAEAERLLGTKEYRDVMTRRRLRDTLHYDMDW